MNHKKKFWQNMPTKPGQAPKHFTDVEWERARPETLMPFSSENNNEVRLFATYFQNRYAGKEYNNFSFQALVEELVNFPEGHASETRFTLSESFTKAIWFYLRESGRIKITGTKQVPGSTHTMEFFSVNAPLSKTPEPQNLFGQQRPEPVKGEYPAPPVAPPGRQFEWDAFWLWKCLRGQTIPTEVFWSQTAGEILKTKPGRLRAFALRLTLQKWGLLLLSGKEYQFSPDTPKDPEHPVHAIVAEILKGAKK